LIWATASYTKTIAKAMTNTSIQHDALESIAATAADPATATNGFELTSRRKGSEKASISLLTFIGEIGVNLEDLNLEHSPGAPIGLVELQVLPEVATKLSDQLVSNGWRLV
jgi:hypothetical protein